MHLELRWVLALVASLGLLLSACPTDEDDDSSAGDDDTNASGCPTGEPPTADIIQPSNTAQFAAGETVHFLAHVDDDSTPPTALEIHWIDDLYGDETEFTAPGPSATGDIEFDKSDFPDGIHIIRLRVTDSDGCEFEESSTLSMGEV
jgi:hypothetical protein